MSLSGVEIAASGENWATEWGQDRECCIGACEGLVVGEFGWSIAAVAEFCWARCVGRKVWLCQERSKRGVCLERV